MTSFDDLNAFFYRYTSSEQAVREDSEEVRFIPYVEITFIDELPFLSPGGTEPATIKLTIFVYQGSDFVTLKSMSSHNKSLMGSFYEFSNNILDK